MVKDLQKINQWFKKVGEKIVQQRWLIILVLIALFIFGFRGLSKIQLESSYDSWFFPNDPIKIATDEFEEVFGNTETAAILVEAEDIFSYQVLSQISELSQELADQVPWVKEVISLTNFEFSQGTNDGLQISNLIPDKIPSNKSALETIRKKAFSKPNLVNRLFTDDSKNTWIMIKLRDYPKDYREKKGKEPGFLVGKKINEIISQTKYQDLVLKATGEAMVNYEKKEFVQNESKRITMLAIIVAIITLVILLRSFRGLFIPLFTTISAIIIAYGTMGHLGIKIDEWMFTVPIFLGLSVSIGYSIHIFNFFNRKFKKMGNRKEAIIYAIENTGWPLFFTALTTIGSLLSFSLVRIRGVQWTGFAAASVISIVYLFTMLLTPALLSIGWNKKIKSSKQKKLSADNLMTIIANFVLGNSKLIAITTALIVLFSIIGLSKVKIDMSIRKSMGDKVPYISRMLDVAQSKIGSLYSYNAVIEFPQAGMVKDPDVLKRFELFEAKLKEFKITKRTTSILDIIKDMNRTLHADKQQFYKIPDSQAMVSQLLFLYENSGGSQAENWVDYDYTTLRIMVEIDDYIAKEVKGNIEAIQNLGKQLFPEAKTKLTGSFVQFAAVQEHIASGQIKAIFFALLVISILMMIVFRSIKTGIIGLIPNIAPLLIIGSIMGLRDIPLDMMTMIIGPMIMGIAVDDTIHFISHLKLEIETGDSYDQGIINTFKNVGAALFMTTLILILSFGVYMTSQTNIYSNMGSMIVIGLSTALIADYCLTPILIKWLKPFKNK